MQNIAIHKAQELSAEVRQAVEHVLGKRLRGDEEVSIMALSPHEAPSGRVQQAVAHKLEQRIKNTAKRVEDVPDDQIEETIGEALGHVRSHPQ